MENSGSNLTIVNGDLLELSPMRLPHPILKPTQKDNLIMLQTPVQKNLRVSFLTPKRTPLKDHNFLPNTSNNPGQVPTNFAPKTSSHAAVNNIDTVRQSTLPILMKTPNSLKGFKSSLMVKEETAQGLKEVTKKNCDSKWESLRKLDENSRWKDRVEVITKLDHEEYTECAQEVIHEMISRAVDIGESKPFVMATKELSETTGKLVAPALVVPKECSGSAKNLFAPAIRIQYDQNGSDNTNNIMLKPRHNTYDVASPMFNESSCNKPVISPGEESSKSKSFLPDTLPDLHCVKSLQPYELNVASTMFKSARSFSDGTDTPIYKISTEAKARHQSLDLDQIKFDFDPITTHCDERNLTGQTMKKSPTECLNQSVFSPAIGGDPQPEFALRAVDSIFGDSDFVDSTKLIDQGHLDLDYLEKKTSGTISAELQKESLYVRFDPLLEGLGNRQSIALLGRKSDIIDFCGRVTPIPEEAGEDQLRLTERKPDLLCDSPPRIIQEDTVGDNNQRTAKLESSGSNSSVSFTDDHSHDKPSDNGIIEVLKYTDADLQRALQKRKDKWMKEKSAFEERHRLMKEKMTQLKITKQNLVQRCVDESNRYLKERAEIEEHMAHQRGEQQMANAATKELTDKMSKLFREMENLQNSVANHKSNEEKLRDISAEMLKKKNLAEEKMKQLEEETEEKMKKINCEKASVDADFTAQMNKLKLKMRATELRAESCRTALDMKHKEKQELLQICDELVASNERRS